MHEAISYVDVNGGQFTCLNGHLPETYRHRVRVSDLVLVLASTLTFTLTIGGLKTSESAQLHFGQMTLRTNDL